MRSSPTRESDTVKKRCQPCRRICSTLTPHNNRARTPPTRFIRVGIFFGRKDRTEQRSGLDRVIPVGILGATGMVGQQFIALLANHPWFKVEWLGASQRSEGKAFRDAAAWRLPGRCPDDVANRRSSTPPRRAARRSWCSRASIPRSPAKSKRAFAEAGHIIVSNSRNYRMEPTVPLLIPEVNADHLALLDAQGAGAAGRGAS